MTPMKDNIFLDSNILVYSYSVTEIEKQVVARNLIVNNNTFISTQVLQEVCNIVTKKFKFSYQQASIAIIECSQNNNVHTNTINTILQACKITERYGFSFYDSLILSAALEANCTSLYSEDLHDGQIIEERLVVRNPFKLL